jgi:pyruvate,water dikinase
MRTATAPYLEPVKATARTQKSARKAAVIRETVHGTAASSGTAEGRAVVVTDWSDLALIGRIPRGAVLVCTSAPPDSAIIMPTLTAMAAERGGMLSATAAAARDYRVPAVVGAAGLTAIINDGDILRVDGTRGVVEVVEKRPLKSI